MSPILVRPVREQLEHDRLIRHLQAKFKRKFEVAANQGDEQVAPVKFGSLTLYPDLVMSTGRRLALVIEVESAESTNKLEAMAQWVHFSRARVPFHLYVPMHVYEAARRLCAANQARVSEIWTYRPTTEGFDLVRMYAEAGARSTSPKPAAPTKPAKAPAKPARSKAEKRAPSKTGLRSGSSGRPKTPAKKAQPKTRARKKG